MPDTKGKSQNFISRFFGRDDKGSLSERVGNNEKKITLLKNIIQAPNVISPEFRELGKSPVSESLDSIHIALDQLLQTIRDDQQFEADKAENARKLREQKGRDDDESKLETKFGAVKKIAGKILKPFQSIWSRIWGFISKVLLGNIILKIIKWMGNKQNQEKFKNILRFFKDWWPTMLASYLLFGTGFTKMVVGLLKTIGWGVTKLVGLIPKLMAALAKLKAGKLLKMIPGGGILKGALVGGGILAVGAGAMYAGSKQKEQRQEDNEKDDESTLTVDEFREDNKGITNPNEKKADIKPGQAYGETGTFPGMMNFNKGGQVAGSGNKDTVPAMLTPGEFVMSKGAVQQYGVNTMEAMNAAAGGTNIPVLMPDKKRKGFPGGGRPYAPTGEEFVYSRTERTTNKSVNQTTGEMTKEKTKDKNIGVIQLEDLYANKDQILSQLPEGTTIESIIDGTSGIPAKVLYPILESSDAQAVSNAKQRDVTMQRLQDNNLINPDNTVKGHSSFNTEFNGGGLVQHFKGGGLAVPIRNKRGRIVGYKTPSASPLQKVSSTKSNNIPGTPVKRSSVIAYREQKQKKVSTPTTPTVGNKIPDFNPEAWISKDKIELLGISI